MNQEKMILEMIKMQQELNNQTAGLGWEDGYTNTKKLISWRRCIYMECAELIDSFAWKHWKNIKASIDKDNVVIEVVDIWHFVLSLMISQYKLNGISDQEKLANDIINSTVFLTFCKEAKNLDEQNSYEILNDIEKLIHLCSGFSYDIFDILHSYFTLALKCGVNLEKLFKAYMGKNVLNSFRQDHGYKDGSYKKNWNGLEDNEVLSQILAQNPKSKEEIYQKLQSLYPKSAKA